MAAPGRCARDLSNISFPSSSDILRLENSANQDARLVLVVSSTASNNL